MKNIIVALFVLILIILEVLYEKVKCSLIRMLVKVLILIILEVLYEAIVKAKLDYTVAKS